MGDSAGGMLGLIGGLIGNATSRGDYEAANAQHAAALAALQSIGVAPDLAAKIVNERFQQAGQLNPALQTAMQQEGTGFNNITEDPRLKDAQMSALSSLQVRGNTGLSQSDLASLNQIQNQSAQANQGQQGQIIQSMQQRGMGGSGAELAARLSGAQSQANNASQNSLNITGQAQQNALSALGQGGQLAGSIRGQDYNVASQRAAAQDQLNRFNVNQKQAAQNANVGAQNQAQQYNLTNAQQISNANIAQANAEQLRETNAKQQMWQDNYMRANALAGGYNTRADQFTSDGKQNAAQWAGAGQGLGEAASGVMKAMSGNPSAAMAGGSSSGVSGGQASGAFNPNGSVNASNDWEAASMGAQPGQSKYFAHGGMIPGHASVHGDSKANDTVTAKMSPGEIVIPRSVTQGPNPVADSAAMVAAILARHQYVKGA
jgi:hypothetical protein